MYVLVLCITYPDLLKNLINAQFQSGGEYT